MRRFSLSKQRSSFPAVAGTIMTNRGPGMSVTRSVRRETASAEVPAVPLTIEGYAVLHQMMRVRWSAWRALGEGERRQIADEAAKLLGQMESRAVGQSALFSLLGHKGDLMLVHFRESFDELNQA